MTQNDIESQLLKLGEDWENDPGFVHAVLDQLDRDQLDSSTDAPNVSPLTTSNKKGLNMLKLNLIGLATSAAVIAALFFLYPASKLASAKSLSAAIRQAVEDVRSIHVIVYSENKATRQREAGLDMWLVPGQGFARISRDGSYFEIDNGTYQWSCEGEDILRSSSRLSEFDLGDLFPEASYERVPEEDVMIDGHELRCFSHKSIAPFEEGPQRYYVYVTKENRIFKSKTWMFKDDKWNFFSESIYRYNEKVDPNLFKPDLGDGSRVIDLKEQFDELTNLRDCLFQEESGEFKYAVHRAKALKDGGVAIFASIRPSETNSTPRQNARVFGAPQSNDYRIELGAASYDSIDARWFFRVPRNPDEKWSHMNDGQLKLSEVFTRQYESVQYDSANSFSRHIDVFADIELEVENWREPISLEQAAREVYQDHQKIPNISSRSLNAGVYIKDGTPYQRTSYVDSTTEDEYAKHVLEHLEYQRGRDTQRERDQIAYLVNRGTVQVYVPGIGVSGLSSFGDEDLAKAVKHVNLRNIDLTETSITDDGLKHLVGLKKLEKLVLVSTGLSDEGLKHLQGLKSLESLDVRETHVTEGGLDELKQALPELNIESDFEK